MENEVDVTNITGDAAANVPAETVVESAAVAKKSVIVMGDTAIEVYHSFTLGDMYICLLLMVLVIIFTLNALIGRR